MRRPVFYLSLAVLALALETPSQLHAQYGQFIQMNYYRPSRYDYDAYWNFNRTYHYFMSSPYTLHSYSTTPPSYMANLLSPQYGPFQGYYTSSGYITPQMASAYQAAYAMPATAGYTATPYAGNYSYTPNYGYSYYAPNYNYSNYAPNYGYYP